MVYASLKAYTSLTFENIKILNRDLIQNDNRFHEYYFHLTAEENSNIKKQ